MRDVITGLADWRGPKILTRQDWIHRFSPSELAEIEFAMASAQRAGKTLETLTREDFPLPTLGVRFQAAKDYLLNGLGLYLFRGIPTDCYSKDELRFLYWGIGKHLGTAVTQSRDGDLLADVRNIGADINSPTGRGHRSKQELSFHCDTCDVVGLFCLRVAKEGGLSLIVSSLAIRNEIARRRPDLLETLYQPYSWSWLGQEALGDAPHYLQPIFTEERGYFSCRLVTNHIANAQRLPGVPRLADAQIEALDLVASIAADPAFHFSMMFEPGDLQLLNNHVTMHGRTAFEDYPEKDRHRHLLRLWLSMPGTQPLSRELSTIYRDGTPGAVRGGFPSRTGTYRYETLGANYD